jgi:DNA polymerase-1
MGIKKFANAFGVSEQEAQKIIDRYFSTYYGFAQWSEEVQEDAKKDGYVRSIFGRIRKFKNKGFSSEKERKAALSEIDRRSVNTLIQGPAGDLIKLAMIKLYARFKRENLDAHLLLTVHDELLVEAEDSIATYVYEVLVEEMVRVVKLNVPLAVDAKICSNWSQMKDDDHHFLPGYEVGVKKLKPKPFTLLLPF